MTQHGSWRRTAAGAGLLIGDDGVRATIFAEMSALAESTGSLNLGQGFPDEDGPAEVLDEARRAIADGANQYPPGRGTPTLRRAISDHQHRFYGVQVDPDTEVVVTAGATEALASAILGFTEAGDDVVTFEPFYDAYGGLIALAGAHHRTVPLRWPDFQPDHDDLRAAVTDKTSVIIVNTPHNPTGSMLTEETMTLIVDLAHRHDAVIVTDEVYEHLSYDAPHVSLASLPGGWERTISISSGGKTFSTTGWKIGWATGPAPLVTALTTVKQFLTYVSGAPFQPAIAVGLGLGDDVFTGIAADLRAKRDLLTDGLASAGFDVARPAAGYFVIADARAHGVDDAAAFCRELPARVGVVGVPVTAFVHPERRSEYATLVRFAFCKRRSVLEDAVSRFAGLHAR
ncbi:aminotransferase class I/II-fold pyridoxal phosphate-dependent enzyme [Okibacterium endophyticum]